MSNDTLPDSIKTYSPEYTQGDFNMKTTAQDNDNTKLASQAVQESKAVAEVQASYLMAKKFPRNEQRAYMNIINSCKRHSFAENAMYAYPRGKTIVTGASIRLAELLSQKWGNCRVGIEVLSQDNLKTEARAFAVDLETNYLVASSFTVKHQRTTKKGTQTLTDERDIREMVANIGSRHLRGCILRVIPSDVVDDAVNQVQKTLESSDMPLSEQIKKMVSAFDELGVKVEHLEKRLGHNLDATIPAEIVTLKGIYRSIKDGMAKREDFFEIASVTGTKAIDSLKEIIGKD